MCMMLYLYLPCATGDAAFGSLTLAEEIQQWGGVATFSMPDNKATHYLWKVLSHSVPVGHWRAAINDKGCVASCCTVAQDGNHNHHKVLSTAFTGVLCSSMYCIWCLCKCSSGAEQNSSDQREQPNAERACDMPQMTLESLKAMKVSSTCHFILTC